jgi:hypothetical protein
MHTVQGLYVLVVNKAYKKNEITIKAVPGLNTHVQSPTSSGPRLTENIPVAFQAMNHLIPPATSCLDKIRALDDEISSLRDITCCLMVRITYSSDISDVVL